MKKHNKEALKPTCQTRVIVREPFAIPLPSLTGTDLGGVIIEWVENALENVAGNEQSHKLGICVFNERDKAMKGARVEVFLDSLFVDLKRDLSPPVSKFLSENGMIDPHLKHALTDMAKTALTQARLKPRPFFWSGLRVDPGAPDQKTHCDCMESCNYWSIIVPITAHKKQGYTQFVERKMMRFSANLSYVFDGQTPHYGTANKSAEIRYALMGVTMPATDENRVDAFPLCAVPFE